MTGQLVAHLVREDRRHLGLVTTHERGSFVDVDAASADREGVGRAITQNQEAPWESRFPGGRAEPSAQVLNEASHGAGRSDRPLHLDARRRRVCPASLRGDVVFAWLGGGSGDQEEGGAQMNAAFSES